MNDLAASCEVSFARQGILLYEVLIPLFLEAEYAARSCGV